MLLRGTPRRTFGAVLWSDPEESENCSFKSMGFCVCLRLVVYRLVSREAYAGCLHPLRDAGSPVSCGLVVGSFQAIKGVWWMPWDEVPTKDAISGETPRGAASELRS